jgi:hypothetical protein
MTEDQILAACVLIPFYGFVILVIIGLAMKAFSIALGSFRFAVALILVFVTLLGHAWRGTLEFRGD